MRANHIGQGQLLKLLIVGAVALPLAAGCGSDSSGADTSASGSTMPAETSAASEPSAGSQTTVAETSSSSAEAEPITTAASADSGAGSETADLSGKEVALVTCEPNVFCHAYNVNLTRQLEEAGATVTQLSDNFDPALQNQHMNQAIAQAPDLIVLFASNADAVVPALIRAQDAGIPVANVNARLKPEGEEYLTFEVVADNAELGRAAAENLVQGMEQAGYSEGNIIRITGTAGTLIVQDRIDAFDEYMKDYPQYEVVATEDGNWDQVLTSQLASQLFTKFQSEGGVQGAYGMADYMAAGIIQAADQAGISTGVSPGDVVVTASNCTPTGIPLMEAGKLWGNATQSPIQESDTAFDAISRFLSGETVEKTITVTEERFTMENVDDFVDLCANWPN